MVRVMYRYKKGADDFVHDKIYHPVPVEVNGIGKDIEIYRRRTVRSSPRDRFRLLGGSYHAPRRFNRKPALDTDRYHRVLAL